MNIVNLDGEYLTWRPSGMSSSDTRAKSALHLEVRELLKEVRPTFHILEEVSIPVRRGQTLFLDFFIPLAKMAIEVHGQQHFEFNPHFYKTKLEFVFAQKRDKQKQLWCEINFFNLIVLHKDNHSEWRRLIS